MGFNLLLPEGETQEVVVKAVQNPEGLEEESLSFQGSSEASIRRPGHHSPSPTRYVTRLQINIFSLSPSLT